MPSKEATPRPWEADPGDSPCWGIFGPDGNAVAYLSWGHDVFRSHDVNAANARLIVSAVNERDALMAALEVYADKEAWFFEHGDHNGAGGRCVFDVGHNGWEKARAALSALRASKPPDTAASAAESE